MEFEYPRLIGHSIRILDVILPEGYNSQPVCNFRVTSLEHPPNYTAISYCWGDSTPVYWLEYQNGGSLPVSQTLLALLTSLLKEQPHLSLWVDALCIDQANLAERESQVVMMGEVFKSATHVFLWLGESDAVSTRAFSAMTNRDTGQESLESMFLLLRRPWFQRVWVIQEITVGRNITVGCGDDRIGFDLFLTCIFTIWNTFEYLVDYESGDPAQLGLWCVTRLIHIRHEYQTKLWSGQHATICYETLLQAAFHCNATDKRDMVFAFRGIADSRPVPRPNYSATEEELYRQTAEALLCHGESLDLLALCGTGNRPGSSGLPTWAPDLRYHSFAEPLVPCYITGWNAGGPLQASPRVEADRMVLRLQARIIDQVDVTCPPFESWSPQRQREAVGAVWALRSRLPTEVSDQVWWERVMTTLVVGVDIDDEPLRRGTREWEAFCGDFEQWLTWLDASSSSDDLSEIRHNKYHRTVGPCLDGEAAFMTRSHGLLCVGVSAIEVGDVVCTVSGCRIPLVLRRNIPIPERGTGAPVQDMWFLIGWCYADGLMFGEAGSLGQPLEEILLG